MEVFSIGVDLGSGLFGKLDFKIFNWNMLKRVSTTDIIVMDHVEVSNCGISLRRGLNTLKF